MVYLLFSYSRQMRHITSSLLLGYAFFKYLEFLFAFLARSKLKKNWWLYIYLSTSLLYYLFMFSKC